MSMMMTKKHSGTLNKQPSQDLDGTTQNREDSTGPDSLQTERGLSTEEGPDCPRFLHWTVCRQELQKQKMRNISAQKSCSSSGLTVV